jgi:hypothetical protein
MSESLTTYSRVRVLDIDAGPLECGRDLIEEM